jgi:hypothetical protein
MPAEPTKQEQWKPIPRFPQYEASDQGRIRGRKVLKPWTDHGGYRCVAVRAHNKKRTTKVHVLVLGAFVGPRPEGYECSHENGDQLDNRLSNLRWATSSHNKRKQQEHGTASRGERHALAKLDENAVRAIRRLAADGESHSGLARRYAVSQSLIWAVIHRRSWAHVS